MQQHFSNLAKAQTPCMQQKSANQHKHCSNSFSNTLLRKSGKSTNQQIPNLRSFDEEWPRQGETSLRRAEAKRVRGKAGRGRDELKRGKASTTQDGKRKAKRKEIALAKEAKQKEREAKKKEKEEKQKAKQKEREAKKKEKEEKQKQRALAKEAKQKEKEEKQKQIALAKKAKQEEKALAKYEKMMKDIERLNAIARNWRWGMGCTVKGNKVIEKK
uniref:Chromatin assembly factor 1 subunit A-B-like n=1 Tax=Cicer arietinum TaxID=3827 RepID=A0A1S2XMQ8_CICAR|nr:chromatin assembly factor 1 subunit A-B-like [Cicer arietinum]